MSRIVSWGEVRLSLRLIIQQPILSATVVLALATGICLATMGFTFREELVNATLPYAAGDRFRRLEAQDKDRGRIDHEPERYHALRDRDVVRPHRRLRREAIYADARPERSRVDPRRVSCGCGAGTPGTA